MDQFLDGLFTLFFLFRQNSSVAEQLFCNQQVISSNLISGLTMCENNKSYIGRKVYKEWGDFSAPDEGTIISEPNEDSLVTIEWSSYDVPYSWNGTHHVDDIHNEGWKPKDHWFGSPKGIFFH